MIRMIQSSSASHAKSYFAQALSQSDYYLDDQELAGRFEGKLAQRLGIAGIASKEAFHALSENRHPGTGERLTARTKAERRIGYDINFHCPKSVSILHALVKDDHVLEAFEASVSETMRDIEANAKTRVRKGKQSADRTTGELAWASFSHQTARPVEGSTPDPHLHAHCFVFNATWDKEEGKFKAGEFGDIKRGMPYYQACFHKRLSDKLLELGYAVRRTDKSFEVEIVPENVVELFSKRTNEIGQFAEEKGIIDAKELAELGARTRAKKQKGLSMAELRADWKQQIRALEGSSKEGVSSETYETPARFASSKRPHKSVTADDCVKHAISHVFERASVVERQRLLVVAARHAVGNKEVRLADIIARFDADDSIISVTEKGRKLCTTREVLAEEKRMVELARSGKGRMLPIYMDAPDIDLEGQQAAAVAHLLTTSDRVSIVRGAAGSGKTTLMKEAVRLIEKRGRHVTIVAPTASASRGVLAEEGFSGAQTVAKLLTDTNMQASLRGQVLWVDEAGLLGTKDMTALLEISKKNSTRLILGGDTRQHASVLRGDALRILNTVAGVQTAEVSKIYRQRREDYRQVVEALSQGQVAEGFNRLDTMGAIKEVDREALDGQLADDYLAVLKRGETGLIIAPTHAQGNAVTMELRKRLRVEGLIGKRELELSRLVNLHLTAAEKGDVRSYREGHTVQFNQNLPGLRRGSNWKVSRIELGNVWLRDEAGMTAALPLHRSEDFDIFAQERMGLSKGDKVRITRNGFDQEKKRLNNGNILEVVSVSKKSGIVLRNVQSKAQYHITEDFGHLAHAHCVTSHASQGKTVDEVFIAQPAATFGATNAKQFYVSVSRGRNAVHLYTDHKESLLENAERVGDRQSAVELVPERNLMLEAVQQKVRDEMDQQPAVLRPSQPHIILERDDYGPEI